MLESTAVDRFDGLKKSTAQLRSECESFQGFVVDTLDQLESMRVKLAEREGRVQVEHARIDEQREAVTRLRDELDRSGENGSDLEETILTLRAELDQTRQQQEATSQELDATQTQLSEARGELEQARECSHGVEPERLEELQEERAALETELEQARHRAAELANAVAEQKQRLAEERTGWTDELNKLRSLKDMRAPPSIAASASKSAPESAPRSSLAGIGSSDPVVGSVLAQFAQLQKDAASRRSESSE